MKLYTEVEIPKAPWGIGHSDRLMLLGSCFATDIGERLTEAGFRTQVNPLGALYNPASVAVLLERLIDKRPFVPEEIVDFGAEGYGSWEAHSLLSRPTPDEALQVLNERLEHAAMWLRETDVLIVTFGTAWVYRLGGEKRVSGERLGAFGAIGNYQLSIVNRRQTESHQACLNRRQTESHQACLNGRGAKEEDEVNGRGAKEEDEVNCPNPSPLTPNPNPNLTKVVANCHHEPPSRFVREMLTVDAIVHLWQPLLHRLAAVRPNLRILFTVSPIRHLRDGAHGNQLSKATLLLAVETLLRARGEGLGAFGAIGNYQLSIVNRRQTESHQACLNRCQTESHQACLNGRGAKEEDEVNGRGAKEEDEVNGRGAKEEDEVNCPNPSPLTSNPSPNPSPLTPNPTYFPSYEIVLDELRDYRFYADDLTHPAPIAVERVWERFADTFFDASTRHAARRIGEVTKALRHRPLHPGSDEYRRFVRQILLKIADIQKDFPYFEAGNLIDQCHTLLNS